MVTPSANEVSWVQFDRFVRAGVPHAMDIAQALAKSSLAVPTSPSFDLQVADLLYYGPVHSAHRRGLLSRFLSVLETLREHEYWQVLRNCRSAQVSLVETFVRTSVTKDNECVELLTSWMRVQGTTTAFSERTAVYAFKCDPELRRAA